MCVDKRLAPTPPDPRKHERDARITVHPVSVSILSISLQCVLCMRSQLEGFDRGVAACVSLRRALQRLITRQGCEVQLGRCQEEPSTPLSLGGTSIPTANTDRGQR